MPRIVVAEQVRNWNPAISPSGQQALETNEAFGNQMPVFDVPVKHVPEQIQMIDVVPMCLKTFDESLLFVLLRRPSPTAKMHVRHKENHRIRQDAG
jgi:hypothetical protein